MTAPVPDALLRNDTATFALRRYAATGWGGSAVSSTDVISGGSIVGYEQFLHEGVALERVAVSDRRFNLAWLSGGFEVELDWQTDP